MVWLMTVPGWGVAISVLFVFLCKICSLHAVFVAAGLGAGLCCSAVDGHNLTLLCVAQDAMVMGADYYESEDQRAQMFAAGRLPIGIGAGAVSLCSLSLSLSLSLSRSLSLSLTTHTLQLCHRCCCRVLAGSR